ncbi:MAG: hypothetical protein MI892_19335, partial [Desulfobacterales bacterium]|nr:hypothetical protein [Desulfobacterales bacterium]
QYSYFVQNNWEYGNGKFQFLSPGISIYVTDPLFERLLVNAEFYYQQYSGSFQTFSYEREFFQSFKIKKSDEIKIRSIALPVSIGYKLFKNDLYPAVGAGFETCLITKKELLLDNVKQSEYSGGNDVDVYASPFITMGINYTFPNKHLFFIKSSYSFLDASPFVGKQLNISVGFAF